MMYVQRETNGGAARARALIVLGTSSHVGKSVIATAFCRLFAEEGIRVAPFKAQNMALNSFVVEVGGEIGRAQAAQAEAAGIEPTVDMNPVLLKPMRGVSQVVVDGAPIGVMSAREYYNIKHEIWPRVTAAYDRLARECELVVIEGAGSPVEINLIEHDLTNMRMARYAKAAAVIVADIERGGVFAHLVGTWELLPREDRDRVVGFVINKFRGDESLLASGLDFIRTRTGVSVLGVLPYRAELQVDQEDSLGLVPAGDQSSFAHEVDVAIARLPGLSNFNDFDPLARLSSVRVRYVSRVADLGTPDLLILPGTKTTVADLAWLRSTGLAHAIQRLAGRDDGPIVIGVCGGYQMLGMRIDDVDGVETDRPGVSVEGLGLLDVQTRFEPEKTRLRVSGRVRGADLRVVGYEIHMGRTHLSDHVEPWIDIDATVDSPAREDGAVNAERRVFGTYIHGIFDEPPVCVGVINVARARRGLTPLDALSHRSRHDELAARYAGLAELLRQHIDLGPIRAALGLTKG